MLGLQIVSCSHPLFSVSSVYWSGLFTLASFSSIIHIVVIRKLFLFRILNHLYILPLPHSYHGPAPLLLLGVHHSAFLFIHTHARTNKNFTPWTLLHSVILLLPPCHSCPAHFPLFLILHHARHRPTQRPPIVSKYPHSSISTFSALRPLFPACPSLITIDTSTPCSLPSSGHTKNHSLACGHFITIDTSKLYFLSSPFHSSIQDVFMITGVK